MTILLIEDDQLKAETIMLFVVSQVAAAQIKHVRSFQSGLEALLTAPPDLVLLDMTLPQFDLSDGEGGDDTRHYGGRDILSEMSRADMGTPAIVVTQFDTFGKGNDVLTLSELDRSLRVEFRVNYLGAVFYNASESSWREKLRKLLLERTTL